MRHGILVSTAKSEQEMPDRQFVFASFRLDPANQRLWQDEELVPLRPKVFAVLHRLVEHAGGIPGHPRRHYQIDGHLRVLRRRRVS
jgi:DNA-binding response OmpR family regulator